MTAQIDALPPVQYLIMDTLAAGARLGEACWTFPSRVRPALDALGGQGLLWWKFAPAPGLVQAFLTEAGRAAVLPDRYRPPARSLLHEESGSLAGIQAAAWANKVAKGFSLTDVPLEFCLLQREASEAFEAWRRQGDVGSELADVVIFAAGLAQILGIDLQAEVAAKLAVNAARTYRALENGCHVKEPAEGDQR